MKYNPYSISKIACYEQCPGLFKYKYIDKVKIPFTKNLALYKGSYIHSVIENGYDYDTEFKTTSIFTEEKRNEANEILRKFENSDLGKKYKNIESDYVHEEKFGIKISNSKLELCSYYDKEAFIRGAIDFYYLEDDKIYCIDWKTGKDKSQDEEFGINQSMAYAIYLFLKYPNKDIIHSKFVFIEHIKEKTIIYTRDNFKDYVKHFYNLVKIIEEDNIHGYVTSPLCDYCDYYNHGVCNKPLENAQNTEEFMNTKISF